jgi:hypothetical protein
MTPKIQTTALLLAMAFVVSACAEDKVIKSTKASVTAEVVQVSTTPPAPEAEEAKAPPEVRRVCIDRITRDGRPVLGNDGKPLQDCRNMRVHKKLEGTVVPPAR